MMIEEYVTLEQNVSESVASLKDIHYLKTWGMFLEGVRVGE